MIVYFTVEGGFANLARSIAIADDGAVEVRRGGKSQLGVIQETDLQAIVTDLDDPACSIATGSTQHPPPAPTSSATRSTMKGPRSWPTTPPCRRSYPASWPASTT